MTLTPSELAQIKARADAATDGPWVARGCGYHPEIADHGCFTVRTANTLDRIKIDVGNAEFIAYSRTDIPRLLEHVDALENRLASITDEARDCIKDNAHLRAALDASFIQMRGLAFKVDEKADPRDPYAVGYCEEQIKKIRAIARGEKP